MINSVRLFIATIFFMMMWTVPHSLGERQNIVLPNEEPLTNLTVVVIYSDLRGQDHGVGKGVPIFVFQNNKEVSHAYTNSNSQYTFSLPYGTYHLEAYYFGPTNYRYFVWVCKKDKTVTEPTTTAVIHCEEIFILLLPFIDE